MGIFKAIPATGFEITGISPEVALGWDFFGIPIPKSQIAGIWDFFSPKKSRRQNPEKSQIPGIGIFFRGKSQNPKNPENVL